MKISPFTGNEISTMCPKCEEDRDREEREREERERIAKIERRVASIGIPLRFAGKRLADLTAKTAKQKAVLKGVAKYLDALKSSASASLILCGMPGTGKTHIGCALAVEVARMDKSVCYITTAQLMRAVKSTYRREAEETEDDVIQRYGEFSLLIIDEIGVQFGSDTERNIFHEIIDRRYGNLLPTVLISNLPADELSAFIGERAFDRCKEDGGAILAFDWESYRR